MLSIIIGENNDGRWYVRLKGEEGEEVNVTINDYDQVCKKVASFLAANNPDQTKLSDWD